MRARTQLKNFTLVETLGAGGMGAVYRALDTNLDRNVALKVVRKEFSADAEYLAKFEREARITASVNHPHVVKVYSFGSDHGLFYIAMELVDKGSLDDLMSLQQRVAEVQALQVGIQVAQGLQAALQKGLIHRDVKPGNILFADAQTAKIVDFGLALLAAHEAEERGEVWGTPYYVAPEKLDHQPEDFRSDLYSLGGTLFHAIAGRPPFEAETASMVALKHLKSQAVSLQAFAPDVSSATAYVINRMLHKDPDQRYQSYAELIEHMEYAKGELTGAAGSARKPKQRVVVGAGQQKAQGVMTLVLLLVILGLVFGGYHFRDRIFSRQDGVQDLSDSAGTAAQHQGAQLEAARKQTVTGDYAGAQGALKKLNESDLAQPLQNWVTLQQGLISLLQGNGPDARDWFKVIGERSHFSNDLADAPLVAFFGQIGSRMADAKVIPLKGVSHAPEGVDALTPLLFGLKDWELGHFAEADALLKIYLSATPKEPFAWVADYKPLAQSYSDQYATYRTVADAAAAADTPDKRADALKQAQALESQAKGMMAAKLQALEKTLKEKSAQLDAAFHQQAQEAAEKDHAATLKLDKEFTALCADYQFDQARAAAAAAVVDTPGATKEKEALVRKADWLRQFKATLIQDINAVGYPGPLVNRAGAAVADGPKHATAAALEVRTSFGTVAMPWDTLPASALLTMATSFASRNLPAEQAADRQWLCGVFACVEGMARDGRTLLVQASQVKDAYKDQLEFVLGERVSGARFHSGDEEFDPKGLDGRVSAASYTAGFAYSE